MVDRAMMVSLRWLQWFQLVGDRIGAVSRVDAAYDPPSLAAGASVTASVSFDGVTTADFVTGVSFSPMNETGSPTPYIRVIANIAAPNTVSVTFINFGPGAIDLDPGTIRIQVEQ